MERFTYQVPRGNVHISTIMPIINEHSKTVFEMRKQQHRFLARIVNGSLRYGIPYCYKIANEYTKPLYTIDCVFPGIRYKLIEHSSSQIVQIVPLRVQLIEKAYSFRLDSHEYYFEKDYTSSGYLKYDNQQVATVSMPIKYDISLESDTIIIKATTEEFAALAAVLYHTFYYYGA